MGSVGDQVCGMGSQRQLGFETRSHVTDCNVCHARQGSVCSRPLQAAVEPLLQLEAPVALRVQLGRRRVRNLEERISNSNVTAM